MPDFPTRIHIIGEPDNGIVITTFNPFRVITTGWVSIQEYANAISGTEAPDTNKVYQDICYALTMLVMDLSDGESGVVAEKNIMDSEPAMKDLKNMGVYVNDADLCLSAMINLELHNESMSSAITSRRFGYQMFHGLINSLLDGSGENPMEFEPHEDDGYGSDDNNQGH